MAVGFLPGYRPPVEVQAEHLAVLEAVVAVLDLVTSEQRWLVAPAAMAA